MCPEKTDKYAKKKWKNILNQCMLKCGFSSQRKYANLLICDVASLLIYDIASQLIHDIASQLNTTLKVPFDQYQWRNINYTHLRQICTKDSL